MKKQAVAFILLAFFLVMATGSWAFEIKWSQPPDMEFGVNIQSTEPFPLVADDWQCLDPRPVSDVHFWGSYIGWQETEPVPNPIQGPPQIVKFIIRIYSDVPANAPGNDLGYSHPGELLYVYGTTNFTQNYVDSIPHTITNPEGITTTVFEHKYYYSLDLLNHFDQTEGTIYWISIAAVMNDIADFPWGWETCNPADHWNDNACIAYMPNEWKEIKLPMPDILPEWYPHETVDMAFQLSVPDETPPPPALEPIKWQQRPDMKQGVNIISIPEGTTPEGTTSDSLTVADDWLCLDGSPVSDLHFWGSYPGWMETDDQPQDPTPGVEAFRIQVYSDVPVSSADGFSHPGRLLYEVWVNDFTETYVASIPLPWGQIQIYEHKYRYDLDLPRIFWQKRNRIYWLNISAIPKPTLDDEIKWSQPPDLLCGVNIQSTELEHIVADDWLCNDPRPITDVHFWGSYIGFKQGEPDPPLPLPNDIKVDYFVIRFYRDVPAGSNPDYPWSHPGELLLRTLIPRTAFIEEYVQSTLLPDNTYEHKFYYSLDLPSPFVQTEGEIYWIAISASYEDAAAIEYPWGWETRDPYSGHYNDNACIFWRHNNYWDDIVPWDWPIPEWYNSDDCHPNISYIDMAFELSVKGDPIPWGWESSMDRWNDFAVEGFYHDPSNWHWSPILHHWTDEYIDMSFELTTCEGPIKWLQFPDMADGRNIVSVSLPDEPVVADDWLCTNGKPITEVHFWGSYLTRDGTEHWEQNNPGPPYGILPTQPRVEKFKLSFHRDVPAGVDADMPWSHPGDLIREVWIDYDGFEERYWDSIPHTETDDTGVTFTWWEHKFYYIVNLQEPFRQEEGHIYWLDIGAQPIAGANLCWGWETSKDHWNDNAVRGDGNWWQALGQPTIDFEDLTLGTTYTVGSTFTTGGTSILVKPFQWSNGVWTSDGRATVVNFGNAGGSGLEINVNNVNLEFAISNPLKSLTLLYGDHGGNCNISINGDFRNFNDLMDINGMTIGGVLVEVTTTAADPDKGKLKLVGTITQFFVGGQEFFIDDVMLNSPTDMAFLLITADDTPFCQGDFDRDGDVDGTDLAVFAADFGRTDCFNCGDCEGDFDYDGNVDKDDLALFAADFGRTDCPCAIVHLHNPN